MEKTVPSPMEAVELAETHLRNESIKPPAMIQYGTHFSHATPSASVKIVIGMPALQ